MGLMHQVFSAFEPYRGFVSPSFHVEYLGERYRTKIIPSWPKRHALAWYAKPQRPKVDEEYFEWIDLLEAVRASGETFTMLELGAGFGRWSVRGARAARRLGKRVRLCAAEAEPKHAGWLRQTMRDNGVKPHEYKLEEAAVGGARGEAIFAVEQPEHSKSSYWFGQAITQNSMQNARVVGTYFGRDLWEMSDGWRVIYVPVVPLSDVLAPYDYIDIIDFDVQGAEADAIGEAIEPLTQKTKRLHIGTHGHDIEARLRETLSTAGWQCLRDYPCHQTNATDYGPVSFVDGVQSWINPALTDPAAE